MMKIIIDNGKKTCQFRKKHLTTHYIVFTQGAKNYFMVANWDYTKYNFISNLSETLRYKKFIKMEKMYYNIESIDQNENIDLYGFEYIKDAHYYFINFDFKTD